MHYTRAGHKSSHTASVRAGDQTVKRKPPTAPTPAVVVGVKILTAASVVVGEQVQR